MHGGHHPAPVRGSALFLWLARRRVLWVVLVLGMLRVLVAGAGEATLAQAGASRGAHRVRIAWKSCGRRLQCARVQVPLDWARPAEGTITLALIRHLATRSDRRLGSLFVNFGGPGVAAVPMVRSGGALLDTLGEGRFDVIGWDPRGTGASTHVQCFADAGGQTRFWGNDWSVPTTARASSRYVPKTVAFGRRCAARSGRLLAHISTADTARDLDYLRALVGDPRLTYLGYSYGSFLGQTYASMFPRRVRAMVLDGIVDPVAFTTSVEAQVANSVADTTLVLSKVNFELPKTEGSQESKYSGSGRDW